MKKKICLVLLLSCSVSSFNPFGVYQLIFILFCFSLCLGDGLDERCCLDVVTLYRFLRLNFESVCNLVSCSYFFSLFVEAGDPVHRMWYVEYQIIYAIHMSIHYFHVWARARAKITVFDGNNLIFHCGDWFTFLSLILEICSRTHVRTTLPNAKNWK